MEIGGNGNGNDSMGVGREWEQENHSSTPLFVGSAHVDDRTAHRRQSVLSTPLYCASSHDKTISFNLSLCRSSFCGLPGLDFVAFAFQQSLQLLVRCFIAIFIMFVVFCVMCSLDL